MSARTLSIVIPAYNEADRLSSTLTALLDRVDEHDTEIIVVDDGSTDDTASVAKSRLASVPTSRVVTIPHQGKGAAVRAGVLASTASTVMFMDADLATNLDALPAALAALEGADVVAGSRAVPGSEVKDATMARAVMGRAFNRLVRTLARVKVHDTQCGFKVFRGPAAHLLFSLLRETGFGFDAELLVYARILGMRVVEVPVQWTAVEGSKVRPVSDSIRTALSLARCIVRARPSRVRARARALGWQPSADADLLEAA